MNEGPFALDDGSSGEFLKGVVRELEMLEDKAADIREAKRDVRARAKEHGIDLPALAKLLQRRRLSPEDVIEGDALLESYELALGCGAAAVGVLATSRNADGSFEVKMAVGPAAAEQKLTKSQTARRNAVALAELAQRARAEGP
ncbi:hypothetical protein BH09PSE4_BH09PSE4_22850 [soil metagenome]